MEKSAAKGYRHADREALNDLLGDQRLLRHLCDMADADADVVAGAMLAVLDSVRAVA